MQTKLRWDPDVLEPVFRELYSTAMKDKKDFIPDMYGIENSTKDTESYEGIGGEGLLEEWGRSGNQVHYEDIDELWQKRIRNFKYSGGREIDRDLIDDLKLPQIKDKIRGLADATYKTQQYQAVEVFNNAFTVSGVDFRGRPYNSAGPDGKALCANDHPYSPTNSVDVQSNLGDKELSIDTWDETVVAMQEWVDDKGNLMAVMPDRLIVAPYNRRIAFQIAGIPGKEIPRYEPGSEEFNINIYQGEITVVVNPFLKNRKAWFAVDTARMRQFNKWQWRRKPENGSIMDFDKETLKYKVIGRWGRGFVNYSFVYGHNPTDGE